MGFNFFPSVCPTMFWYWNLNIKKHTDIIFGCQNDWPWRILKTRNRNCDFKNLNFRSLTRNEFTEIYTFATGGFTVVILASAISRLYQGANSFGVFARWFKSRRGIIFHFFDDAKNKRKRCQNLKFCQSGSSTRSVAAVTLYFTLGVGYWLAFVYLSNFDT